MRILAVVSFSILAFQSYTQTTGYDEAISHFKERKYEEAQKLFETAIEKCSPKDTLLLIRLKLELSKTLLHDRKSEESFNILKETKILTSQLKNDSLTKKVNFSLATLHAFKSNYDTAEVLIKEVLALDILNGKDSSDVFTLLARYKTEKLELDSSLYFIKKSIKIDLKRQDSSSLPYNYLDLSTLYNSMHMEDSSVFYALKGKDYLRHKVDDYKIPGFCEKISNCFIQTKNFKKAEEYARKGLEAAKEQSLKISEERLEIILGDIYRLSSRYVLALKSYAAADSMNQLSRKPERTYKINFGIVKCNLALENKLDESRLNNLADYAQTTKSERERINCELVLISARLKDYSRKESLSKLEFLGNSDGVKNNLKYKREFLRVKYLVEKHHGLLSSALETNEELKLLDVSIRNEEILEITHDLEAKYKKVEQDKEIAFLDSENEIKSELLQSKNKALWTTRIGLGLISILSFLLFGLYRKVNEQKKLISKSLDEKDTLLKEIHHRVKNNLQVVSSLLRLQSNSTTDASTIQALNEGQARVRTMSLIHQNLYSKDNLSGINMKGYLEELSANLLQTYTTNQEVKLTTDIEDLKLDVDTVVPLGLIINELITNSLKYAFKENMKGEIVIILKKISDRLHLLVKDNGVGIKDTSLLNSGGSFGFGLINAFCSKLDADISIGAENGTEVEMVIRNFSVI